MNEMNYSGKLKVKLLISFFELIIYSILIVTLNFYFYKYIKSNPINFKTSQSSFSKIFYDNKGIELYRTTNRSDDFFSPVKLQDIPPACIQAVIKIEDKKFFSHIGFNLKSIFRAAYQNIRAGHTVSGASTITMQLVKLFKGPAKNIDGKLKQIALAWQLEQNYTKQEILLHYFNHIYFGHNYKGIEAASQGYFHKSTKNLNSMQCLSLAVLIKAPSKYNPVRNFENNWKRSQFFLKTHPLYVKKYFFNSKIKSNINILSLGNLSYKNINLHKLKTEFSKSIYKRNSYPEYFNFIEAFFLKNNSLQYSPENIYTSLNKNKQDKIQIILNNYIKNKGQKKNINQACVIVLDNQNHNWLVWTCGSSGNSKKQKQNWINGPLVLRQPGSTLKPFLYALAMENKNLKIDNTNLETSEINFYHPAYLLNDFSAENYKAYGNPPIRNYNDHYYGRVSLRKALGNSLNVAAAELLSKIGIQTFLGHIREGPIHSLFRNSNHYGLGLILGDGEVTLRELVQAYSTFANAGLYYNTSARKFNSKSKAIRLYSPGTAYLMYHILKDNEARKFSFGYNQLLNYKFPLALKTGTSEGFRDNWIIAFTKLYTVGVWVGNYDRSPMINSTGLSGAGPVLKKTIDLLHKNKSVEDITIARPDGLVEKIVCIDSAKLASSSCPNVASELFSYPYVPSQKCSIHKNKQDNFEDSILQSYKKIKTNSSGKTEDLLLLPKLITNKLQILKPLSNSIFKLSKTTPDEYKKIIFKISLANTDTTSKTKTAGKEKVYIWRLNNNVIYEGSNSFFIWQLKEGKYELKIEDEGFVLDKHNFTVIE